MNPSKINHESGIAALYDGDEWVKLPYKILKCKISLSKNMFRP